MLSVALCVLAGPSAAAAAEREWCAPEIETLSDGMCFFSPDAAERTEPSQPATLVLFLHSLVAVRSDWQWEQQRQLVRAARAHGVSVLMPRGRAGIGPGRAPDVWAWPTSRRSQDEAEAEILEEWARARAQVEQRRGRPFERLLVFGFSNGAYYASSLALRDRLPADGYGVFAGGSGGRYASVLGSQSSRRAPIFVGFGTKDPAHRDMRSLVVTLKKLGWRHRVRAERVGHVVTNAQLDSALRFLSEDRAERVGALHREED